MFLERFRNVVQTILTQNPQKIIKNWKKLKIFLGLRPKYVAKQGGEISQEIPLITIENY